MRRSPSAIYLHLKTPELYRLLPPFCCKGILYANQWTELRFRKIKIARSARRNILIAVSLAVFVLAIISGALKTLLP